MYTGESHNCNHALPEGRRAIGAPPPPPLHLGRSTVDFVRNLTARATWYNKSIPANSAHQSGSGTAFMCGIGMLLLYQVACAVKLRTKSTEERPYQQDRKAHEKCEAYALVMLVYMKIEKGAEGRQNTVLVHLGSSLKSKIISFLLIKKDFKIIVVAFFELKGNNVWRMRFLKA